MLNNVSLHLVGQMLNDQKLNLTCDVSYILQQIVLGIESFGLCMITTYLYFKCFSLDVHILPSIKHH